MTTNRKRQEPRVSGKPITAWAIENKSKEVLCRTISWFEDSAIENFCMYFKSTHPGAWNEYKKLGYRCVKVLITKAE